MSFEEYNIREFIGAIPEALLLVDQEGTIREADSKAREVFGYEREELCKLSVNDLLPKAGPSFFSDHIKGPADGNPPT